MLRLILNQRFAFSNFKIDKFERKDYQTMCGLIKQKFPIYNQSIEINKDIKLLDQNGKLIGRYAASQARKKASNMKKDIILLNSNSTPAICKLVNFRESILKKFLEQIVTKRNEQLFKKASTTKQLKISTSLSTKQLQIKAKQIIELAKKNLNVRVYSICKPNHRDEGLSLFDHLKSLVLNKCIVQKDIKAQQYELKDEQGIETRRKEQDKQRIIISLLLKSKQNQFVNLLQQTSNKDPDQAILLFLQRYYKQQDVDMKDLKQRLDDRFDDNVQVFGEKMIQQQQKERKKDKVSQTSQQLEKNSYLALKKQQAIFKQQSYIEQQSKARILNTRLKRILDLQIQ